MVYLICAILGLIVPYFYFWFGFRRKIKHELNNEKLLYTTWNFFMYGIGSIILFTIISYSFPQIYAISNVVEWHIGIPDKVTETFIEVALFEEIIKMSLFFIGYYFYLTI